MAKKAEASCRHSAVQLDRDLVVFCSCDCSDYARAKACTSSIEQNAVARMQRALLGLGNAEQVCCILHIFFWRERVPARDLLV